MEHLPRRHGSVRGRVARARDPARGPRAASRTRSCPLGDCIRSTKARASPNVEKIRSLPTLIRRGARHRGGVEPDQRRVRRAADRERAGGEGPRAQAAGPHPPPQRARRRPDLHAHRADRRHRVRAAQDRPAPRTTSTSSRSTRRSRRSCSRGSRRRGFDLGEGERERRRDRARSPARRHRRPAHDHPARTSSSAPAAATACRRCARAAARPTSPSSSACDRPPMIGIPDGTRVYGMQLPIQAQSQHDRRRVGARRRASRTSPRVAQAADDTGFHYVGVCDHIAITED